MRRFHEEGKILAIGVSNFSPEAMDRFRTVAPLHTVQPPYNLFERGIENDVLSHVRENNMSSLIFRVRISVAMTQTGRTAIVRSLQGRALFLHAWQPRSSPQSR